jgi:hypothetical protein
MGQEDELLGQTQNREAGSHSSGEWRGKPESYRKHHSLSLAAE